MGKAKKEEETPGKVHHKPGKDIFKKFDEEGEKVPPWWIKDLRLNTWQTLTSAATAASAFKKFRRLCVSLRGQYFQFSKCWRYQRYQDIKPIEE